jgi:hypothetical protein
MLLGAVLGDLDLPPAVRAVYAKRLDITMF